MSDVVILVDKISKRYRIGQRERYLALRDVLANTLRAPFRLFRDGNTNSREAAEYIWALKDICLEVKQGEIVGLIGRNGAGKTTLLKVLSRITKPTSGHAEIRGRVGSLLEVGTGFHPELTGRENVYFSGSILGMRKSEIEQKFDEIVAFSGVEKFIETPVKHYSSGMYTRLAFAVAAHLDPEVLLVDEVLAVGDLEFQKKCLGKMEEVSHGGRTVIFVSHHMGSINRLCRSVILLEDGRVKMNGPAAEVIAAYVSSAADAEGERRWAESYPDEDSRKVCLRAVRVVGPDGVPIAAVDVRQPYRFEIEYEVRGKLNDLRIALRLVTSDGTAVFTSCDSQDSSWNGKTRHPGVYVSRCGIPGNFLNEGRYFLTVSADNPFIETFFYEESALAFSVEQTGGLSGKYPERWPGVICPALPWQIELLNQLPSGRI